MSKKVILVIISAVGLVIAGMLVLHGINLHKPEKAPDAEAFTMNGEAMLFDRAEKAMESGDLLKARDIYP